MGLDFNCTVRNPTLCRTGRLYVGVYTPLKDPGIKVYHWFWAFFLLAPLKIAVPLQLKNKRIIYVNRKNSNVWLLAKLKKQSKMPNAKLVDELNRVCRIAEHVNLLKKSCRKILKKNAAIAFIQSRGQLLQDVLCTSPQGREHLPILVANSLSWSTKQPAVVSIRVVHSEKEIQEFFYGFIQRAEADFARIKGALGHCLKSVLVVSPKASGKFHIASYVDHQKQVVEKDLTSSEVVDRFLKQQRFGFTNTMENQLKLDLIAVSAKQQLPIDLPKHCVGIIEGLLSKYKDNFLGDEDIESFQKSHKSEYETILKEQGFYRGYCHGFIWDEDLLALIHSPKLSQVSPSRIINEALSHKSFLSQQMRCQLILYKMLQMLLGEEKFDTIFNPKNGTGFSLILANELFDTDLPLWAISLKCKDAQSFNETDIVKVGIDVYWRGKHPFSLDANPIAFCISNNPTTLFSTPNQSSQTLDQLSEEFVKTYNKVPRKEPVAEDSIKQKLIKLLKPSKKVLSKVSKHERYSLDWHRISALIKKDTSIEALGLFREWV